MRFRPTSPSLGDEGAQSILLELSRLPRLVDWPSPYIAWAPPPIRTLNLLNEPHDLIFKARWLNLLTVAKIRRSSCWSREEGACKDEQKERGNACHGWSGFLLKPISGVTLIGNMPPYLSSCMVILGPVVSPPVTRNPLEIDLSISGVSFSILWHYTSYPCVSWQLVSWNLGCPLLY